MNEPAAVTVKMCEATIAVGVKPRSRCARRAVGGRWCIQHTRGTVTVKREVLERAVEAMGKMDTRLPHVYWTSDDGQYTRMGEPEDADGPEMREAWESIRAALAELRAVLGEEKE